MTEAQKPRDIVAISPPVAGERADSWRAFRMSAGRAPHLLVIGSELDVTKAASRSAELARVITCPAVYTVSAPPAHYRPGHGTGPFECTLPPGSLDAKDNARRRALRALDHALQRERRARPLGVR